MGDIIDRFHALMIFVKDNMLREGVRLHCGDDCPNWLKVAAYVNEQLGEELVNNKQCCDRWIYHADPKLTRMKNKDDEWTDEEVVMLTDLYVQISHF